MAQPDPRSPKGNRSPNGGGGPAEPNFNWKGLVLLAIAIALFGSAYWFKGPMGNVREVTYPQFVEMLKKEEIDKKKGVELVTEPGSATDYIKGHLVNPPDSTVTAQVNLQYDQYLKSTLEDEFNLVVS